MKNNYLKYIKEVWKMKNDAYSGFKKSGQLSYIKYINDEIKKDKFQIKNKETAHS